MKKTFDKGVMIGVVAFLVAMGTILAVMLPHCAPTP